MWTSRKLFDGEVSLRCISEADVGDGYLSWLQDEQVVRFLEIRHSPPRSREELKSYVRSLIRSECDLIMGIFINGDMHVGNIKLTILNVNSRLAEIGILVGNKSYWGQGVATRAINLMTTYALGEMGVCKVSAGCYAPNVGSSKAFLKAGYAAEGTLKDHWAFDGGRVDELLFGYSVGGKLEKISSSYKRPKSIVFFGGGELMLDAIEMAKQRGFNVFAVLAPRHANEQLAGGGTLGQELAVAGVKHAVVESVSDIANLLLLKEVQGAIMALCFGPAWIFPVEVLERFNAGMFNFNGIPIPQYLGGAHFTWQILNGDRQSGCFIQRITSDVDRGAIVCHKFYELPESARLPKDYFHYNREFGKEFLVEYFDALVKGSAFTELSFDSMAGRRMYFPRLNTNSNGWIDWSWDGEAIQKFCNAFDAPYAGASTCYEGRRVHLRGAHMPQDIRTDKFHPYCSGLIVAAGHGDITVATTAGLLIIERVICAESGLPVVVVQGGRFHTDHEVLSVARLHRPRY